MFIGKNRVNFSERHKKPTLNHNHNRAGRRPLAARRVDQALLRELHELHVKARPAEIRKTEYNKNENAIFDTAQAEWQHDEPLPPYQDNRYDIPNMEERVQLGRDKNIPRRIRRDEFPTIDRVHGFDGENTRRKLKAHGLKSFFSLQHATWRRHKWTKARHVEVKVHQLEEGASMPTHFMRISTDEAQGREELMTPFHSAFFRANWSRLADLPEFTPMDICTPIDETGKELENADFAAGELPLINVRVHNLVTMPHLIAYTYLRDPCKLLEQLVGSMSKGFEPFEGQPMTKEQRNKEWILSQKIASHFDAEKIRVHAWFVHDLVENANCVGLEDPAFWWAVDIALRVLMDALVAHKRHCSSEGAEYPSMY